MWYRQFLGVANAQIPSTLLLLRNKLSECLFDPRWKQKWRDRHPENVMTVSQLIHLQFFPKNLLRETWETWQERAGCSVTLCLCRNTYCCYVAASNQLRFSSKGLQKWIPEHTGDDPPEKYRQVLDDIVSIKSTNRVFRTMDHSVATYVEIKRTILTLIYLKGKLRIMEITYTYSICEFCFLSMFCCVVMCLLLHYVLINFSLIRFLRVFL